MVGLRRDKKATTLIETIISILVLGIIGATVIGVIVFLVQLFMYSPRQLDVQKIGQELNRIMLEGEHNARGIRFCRSIIDASAVQFSYTYGYPMPSDRLSVRFRWDVTAKHIYRSTSSDGGISWSVETAFPYYITSATTVDGKDIAGVIFTYKKANDANWVLGTDPLTAIRRVIVSINIKTGTGSFTAYQGSTNLTFSSEIKPF